MLLANIYLHVAFKKFARKNSPMGTIMIRDFIYALSHFGLKKDEIMTKEAASSLVSKLAPSLHLGIYCC